MRDRGVSTLFLNSNRHPQDGVAEEHQFSLTTISSAPSTLRRRSARRLNHHAIVMDDAAIEKEQLKDAKKAYEWTDWVASIFGDLTDIVFAIQPFLHFSLLIIFPYVGLVPVMLGFSVKWMFALFQMVPEFNDKNVEEGGYLMRRMVLVLAPLIVALSFVTVVAVLGKPVMMATIGISIGVEIAYLVFNLVTSIRRHHVARKESTQADDAFMQSLTPEQRDYLLKNKETLSPEQFKQRFQQLLTDSFACQESKLERLLTPKSHLKLYKHFFGDAQVDTANIKPENPGILFSPEQLQLYAASLAADKSRRQRRYDILDRSHILAYSLVQLTGAVLAGLALILFPQVTIPLMLVVGSALLASAGAWALLDKFNIHPLKWTVNKLFNNAMAEKQHGEFELSLEDVVALDEKKRALGEAAIDMQPVPEMSASPLVPESPRIGSENGMARRTPSPTPGITVSASRDTLYSLRAEKSTVAHRAYKDFVPEAIPEHQEIGHRRSFSQNRGDA